VIQVYSATFYGVSGWGSDHPNKDVTLRMRAFDEYSSFTQKTYVHSGGDVAVDFTEDEKKIISESYIEAQRKLSKERDYLVILENVIRLLAQRPDKLKYIHPAHVITADCLRPGCKELNYLECNDWGADLGHTIRNQMAAFISFPEKKALWSAVLLVKPDIKSETFYRRSWTQFLEEVKDEIKKHPDLRRLIPYKRISSPDLLKTFFKAAYLYYLKKKFVAVDREESNDRESNTKSDSKRKRAGPRGGRKVAKAPRKGKTHVLKSKRTEGGARTCLGETGNRAQAGATVENSGSVPRIVEDNDGGYDPWADNWDDMDESRVEQPTIVPADSAASIGVADDEIVDYWKVRGNYSEDANPSHIVCLTGNGSAAADGVSDSYDDGLLLSSCRVLSLNDTYSIPLDEGIDVLFDLLSDCGKLACWKPRSTTVFRESVPNQVEENPTSTTIDGTARDVTLQGKGYLSLPLNQDTSSVFVVVGAVYVKIKGKGKRSCVAICIVPGSSKLVQLHIPYNGGFLRSCINKRDCHPEATLDDGSGRRFKLFKDLICVTVDSNGCVAVCSFKSNEVEFTTRWDEQRGKSSSEVRRLRSSDLSANASVRRTAKVCPTEWGRQADASFKEVLPYYESSRIRIVDDRRYKSSSGLPGGPRQQVLQYSLPDHISKNNFENSGKSREKFIATEVKGVASVEVSSEDLVQLFEGGHIQANPKIAASLSALIFADPCWRLKFFKPKPIRVTEASTDIDQCLGIGRINRVKYLATLAHDCHIEIPPSVNMYEDSSVKDILSHATGIILEEVLLPLVSGSSSDNRRSLFAHYFKAARVTFSKSDVARNRPIWGIRNSSRSRCFYVPCWQGENLVPLQFAIRLHGTKYSDSEGTGI
jgi:hypothetical protein